MSELEDLDARAQAAVSAGRLREGHQLYLAYQRLLTPAAFAPPTRAERRGVGGRRCSVEGCPRAPDGAGGYCVLHYERVRRAGAPDRLRCGSCGLVRSVPLLGRAPRCPRCWRGAARTRPVEGGGAP